MTGKTPLITLNNGVKMPALGFGVFQSSLQLAEKYGKTPAQVVLRWHIDQGLSAIPKPVRPERIAENIDLFDFVLSKDEIATIDALDTGVRAGANPETVDSKTWPIKIDE